MLDNVVSLTKELVSIQSTPNDARALEHALELALSKVKGYTIERFERNGVKSALVHNSPERPRRFKVVLNGHLDIIPGKEDQYTPQVRGDRLYGVGAMDMKANLACLIEVFKDAANRVSYPLGLQLVTDEEVGGLDGTKYQIDEGVRADFVIVGESTDLDIENKAKGILWAKVSTTGKAAHGAYPWQGENAVLKMAHFIARLDARYPIPTKDKWVTTVNLGNIETANKTFNKIPDQCEAWLDVRYIPEEADTIVDDLKKILPEDFELEVVVKEPALSTAEDNSYLRLLRMEIGKVTGADTQVLSANGSSDVRHFTRVSCPGVEFGPVGGGMGSDREWVDIPSLEQYCHILKNFLLSLN